MHLGGHSGKNHIEISAIEFLIKKLGLQSIVDVGCSKGDLVYHFSHRKSKGHPLHVIGIEGDPSIVQQSKCPSQIIIHDFRRPIKFKQVFDLGYSTEFMEHVEQQYLNNYFKVFEHCKYVVYTAAPERWTGVHHVNCQNHCYWLRQFNAHGFVHDPSMSHYLRSISDMNAHRPKRKQFFKHRAIFMINTRYLLRLTLSKPSPESTSAPSKSAELLIIAPEEDYQEMEDPSMAVSLRQVPDHLFKSTIPTMAYLGTTQQAIKELKCSLTIHSGIR